MKPVDVPGSRTPLSASPLLRPVGRNCWSRDCSCVVCRTGGAEGLTFAHWHLQDQHPFEGAYAEALAKYSVVLAEQASLRADFGLSGIILRPIHPVSSRN